MVPTGNGPHLVPAAPVPGMHRAQQQSPWTAQEPGVRAMLQRVSPGFDSSGCAGCVALPISLCHPGPGPVSLSERFEAGTLGVVEASVPF